MIARLLVQVLAGAVIIALLLFPAAGSLDWPEGWALVALMNLPQLALQLWLLRHDPGLLAERTASPVQGAQNPWDRVFIIALILGCIAWFVMMALDARRFGWTGAPLPVKALGALMILIGYAGVGWVFATNSFASPVVKVQEAREQRVIDTGPYALVRHPMYTAGVIIFAGIPLVLGSLWGLIGVPLIAALIGARAVGEEKLLRADLAGYGDYAGKVRFRLIPGVW